jgi:hypothetical protein
VEFAGSRIVSGGNGWLSGNLNQHHLIPELIEKKLFRNVQQPPSLYQPPYQMSRLKYIQCYGPTIGDKVRLGDTELFLEIEKDFSVYGDEIVFGGGKVIRDGMGQMSNISEEKALDLVITNVIVVGIFFMKLMERLYRNRKGRRWNKESQDCWYWKSRESRHYGWRESGINCWCYDRSFIRGG